MNLHSSHHYVIWDDIWLVFFFEYVSETTLRPQRPIVFIKYSKTSKTYIIIVTTFEIIAYSGCDGSEIRVVEKYVVPSRNVV